MKPGVPYCAQERTAYMYLSFSSQLLFSGFGSDPDNEIVCLLNLQEIQD